MAKKRKRARSAKECKESDWLADLDRNARTQSRARNWIEHPYFIFVRYPNLRPEHDPEGFDTILDIAQHTARRIEHLGVLNGLSETQMIEFGALVFDFDSQYEDEKASKQQRVDLAAAKKDVGRRGRMLKKKLGNVSQALSDLADYVEKLERQGPLYAMLIRRRIPRPQTLRDMAQRFESAEPATEPEFEHIDSNLPDIPTPRKIGTDATIALTSYFVTECELSQAEAEIRTAKIGNYLWGWSIEIREKYAGEDKWRRSEAIRSRRRRRKSHR